MNQKFAAIGILAILLLVLSGCNFSSKWLANDGTCDIAGGENAQNSRSDCDVSKQQLPPRGTQRPEPPSFPELK